MERTSQDIIMQAQSYLYDSAEQLDQVAAALAGANNNLSAQLTNLSETGHAIGLEFDQVLATLAGQSLTAQLQSVSLCLTLIQAEFAAADKRVRDRRARLQDGAQMPSTTAESEAQRRKRMEVNNVLYQEAMAYHARTGSAIQVLEHLQDKLEERLWVQNNPSQGLCSACGRTELPCDECSTGAPCGWADAAHTLCSHCVETSLNSAAILAASEPS